MATPGYKVTCMISTNKVGNLKGFSKWLWHMWGLFIFNVPINYFRYATQLNIYMMSPKIYVFTK